MATRNVVGESTKEKAQMIQRVRYGAFGLEGPRRPEQDRVRHVYKENNQLADEQVNGAMDRISESVWWPWERNLGGSAYFRVSFDGRRRGKTSQVGIEWGH